MIRYIALFVVFASELTCATTQIDPETYIRDIYSKILADPQTSWLTKAYMRQFPVKVEISRSCKIAGECSWQTITIGNNFLNKANASELQYVLAHEYMHYKNMHSAKSALYGTLYSCCLSVIAAWIGDNIKKVYDQNSSRDHDRQADKILKDSISLAFYIAGMVVFAKSISRFGEFQADADAARYTGDFETPIRDRWNTDEDDLPFYHPSGEACARNLFYTAKKYYFERLQKEYPKKSVPELQKDTGVCIEQLRSNIKTKYKIELPWTA